MDFGSGAATRVAFWDSSNSLSNNANLFWDNANYKLSIKGITYTSYASHQIAMVTIILIFCFGLAMVNRLWLFYPNIMFTSEIEL